jgi:hypothetical protein
MERAWTSSESVLNVGPIESINTFDLNYSRIVIQNGFDEDHSTSLTSVVQ